MPGLFLEARYALVRACERRALASPRLPGARRLALTPTNCRVLRSLCFDFHNGRTGRTDPGHRALARRAAVALDTLNSPLTSAEAQVLEGVAENVLRPCLALFVVPKAPDQHAAVTKFLVV